MGRPKLSLIMANLILSRRPMAKPTFIADMVKSPPPPFVRCAPLEAGEVDEVLAGPAFGTVHLVVSAGCRLTRGVLWA